MTPSNSHEGSRALSRMFQRKSVAIALSMKTGDGETETATINVPEEALLADCFRNGLDDMIKDALAVRMIQVWVKHSIQGKEVTETMFVPVLGWHLLSVNWQIIIEDYVTEKLFYSPENQAASPEEKRSGPALLFYRKNGESGEPTRKELFHDWLVGLTARGSTIFHRRFVLNWSIPMPAMPPVKPPLNKVDAAAAATV